jgi:hypothetical protein
VRRLAFTGALVATLGAAPPASVPGRDWAVRAPVRADRTGVFEDPRLGESSGVAASRALPGILWTVNDSGNDPVLFATDTLGTDLGAFDVSGASNLDWEDAAVGPCGDGSCVYIADTGDNAEVRAEVAIHRVREPVPGPRARGTTAAGEALRVRYPDAPHDVEAMYVDAAGDVYLVTKGRTGGVLHFRVRGSSWGSTEPVIAEPMGTLPLDPGLSLSDRITGAALSPDGGIAVVRSYRRLHFFSVGGDGRLQPLGSPPVACSVAGLEPQGEAVTWLDAGRLALTSERFIGLAPGTIHVVECPIP